MMEFSDYKKSFIGALGIHLSLVVALLIEPSSHTASMSMEAAATPADNPLPMVEPIAAVNIDNQEVMKKVNELKAEQKRKEQAEVAKQQALQKEAERAKQARIQEQQHLQKLKEEADRIAIARKKEEAEEKKRLQELAQKQEAEKKRLENLKKEHEALVKRQQEEVKKVAELEKKKAQELQKVNQQKEVAQKEAARRQQEQAAAAQAQRDADMRAQQARVAGEVDRYKSMIINAISRQWILPENVNPNLSSQFKIRLAPNGAVLDVSLARSSGDPILDRSAQSAIYKASPLPVPADATTFDMFREITLTVRPESVRG